MVNNTSFPDKDAIATIKPWENLIN